MNLEKALPNEIIMMKIIYSSFRFIITKETEGAVIINFVCVKKNRDHIASGDSSSSIIILFETDVYN